YGVPGPGGQDRPMTIGDVLIYPGTKQDLDRTLATEADDRDRVGKTCNKYGKCLDPNFFGPDLLGHEAVHSGQWTNDGSVGGFFEDYALESANSLYLCGDLGKCNRFELEANPFKGGYWKPITIAPDGEFKPDPETPDIKIVEEIMSNPKPRGRW